MKILVVSSTILPCPPKGYSGLEMIAYLQAKGLAERGHKVSLVAIEGSTAPPQAELIAVPAHCREKVAYLRYRDRLPEFDAVITNSWEKWEYIAKMEGRFKGPVLGVLHAPCHTMYQTPPPVEKPCLVAISKDQASHANELWKREARVCYNAVDLDFYKRNSSGERNSRYLFLGRISTIKGPDIAVEVALRCRIGLDIVGDDTITGEPELLAKVKALSVGPVTYVGPQTREQCVGWYSRNKALLHPIERYREPFGLSVVESQACGMPVIAWDNGSMRELIIPGETGFIVKSKQEMEELIRSDAVSSIRPERCRENAARFSVSRMIDRWEELLRQAIETGGW